MTAVCAILAYHKIGEPPHGTWRTWNYVSTDTFREQLDILREERADGGCVNKIYVVRLCEEERAALLGLIRVGISSGPIDVSVLRARSRMGSIQNRRLLRAPAGASLWPCGSRALRRLR